ncbi:MAG: hypothetical protein WKF48_06265 [Solirubrobacteraceae bacterium]
MRFNAAIGVSFLIPAYNEAATIGEVLQRIRALDLAGNRFLSLEMPIAYYGRTYAEGKKITWRDGVKAIVVLVQVRLRRT